MSVTIKQVQITASVGRPGRDTQVSVDTETLKREILEACETMIEEWQTRRERP